MTCIGTPNNLELLLHCYVSSTMHPRFEASAIQAGIKMLEEADMIWFDSVQNCYQTTQKAKIYIEHLLGVEFPVLQYVMSDTIKS